jgi:hypothetical protein
VASDYNSAISNNTIDNWLVLPRVTGGLMADDTLYFYSRSPNNSAFADSIKVMYSLSDSLPQGAWVELGRFKVSTDGSWERRGFSAPLTSLNGRFAIRYGCVDGGPTGNNTDYAGIDALVIERSTIGIQIISSEIPEAFSLGQNYPNPFNPMTNFKFQIPNSSFVKLLIFDISGKEITKLVYGELKPGTYRADWDASDYSSGIYFYTLASGNFKQTKKMILIK